MQLLAPIYLLGCLAIAAPILIHLIRRRKVTVVPWAAHRFLVSVTKKLQRRKRIDDWILLLLRCFLFLLLALLFARPYLANSEEVVVDETGTLVVLVDASASMQYSNGVRSRFDLAREQVEAALSGLPSSTSVALILFGDQAYPVVSPPTLDHHVLLQELERQTPRPSGSNLGAGLTAALSVLKDRGEGSILLVTDGQASAWQNQPELTELLAAAKREAVRFKILDVSEEQGASNLGITRFVAQQSKPIAGQPVHLQVTVKNGGETPTGETRLVLEQAVGFPVEEAWVPALSPGESTQVTMRVTFNESGWQILTARLPGDHFATDNERSVGLSVTSGLKVAIVEGPRSPELTVDPGFFLSAAAVPVSGPAVRTFPVQMSSLKPSALSGDRLQDFQVVVLAGLSSLSREQAAVLQEFVAVGGGLWITPPSSRSALASFLQMEMLAGLLPASELSLIEGRPGLAESGPYSHAIAGYWNDEQAGSLAGFFSDLYIGMVPVEGSQTVLRLRNESPLFVTRNQGAGRVMLSALPLDGAWSQLPLSPQFVPFVQRTLRWLSGEVDAATSLSPAEGWRVRVPAIHVGRPFYVRTPLTKGSAQLAGQVEFQAGQAIIAYSDTRALGRYEILLDPEGPVVGSFGVNLVAEESDLRGVPESELIQIVGGFADTEHATYSRTSLFARFRANMPDLWMLLAFLIIFTGAVELYFAQRFSRTE